MRCGKRKKVRVAEQASLEQCERCNRQFEARSREQVCQGCLTAHDIELDRFVLPEGE